MTSIFDPIVNKAGDRLKSANWYKKQVSDLSSRISASKLMKQGRLLGRPSQGRLNMFFYDPKLKQTLPYYDTFPLVLPLQSAPGGFLGLNFHYVAPLVRFNILNELQKYATDNKFDANTRLLVTYNKIKRNPYTKAMIKHYLYNHVRSNFLRVDVNEAPVAVLLPVQQFRKQSPSYVYSQSRKNK